MVRRVEGGDHRITLAVRMKDMIHGERASCKVGGLKSFNRLPLLVDLCWSNENELSRQWAKI